MRKLSKKKYKKNPYKNILAAGSSIFSPYICSMAFRVNLHKLILFALLALYIILLSKTSHFSGKFLTSIFVVLKRVHNRININYRAFAGLYMQKLQSRRPASPPPPSPSVPSSPNPQQPWLGLCMIINPYIVLSNNEFSFSVM